MLPARSARVAPFALTNRRGDEGRDAAAAAAAADVVVVVTAAAAALPPPPLFLVLPTGPLAPLFFSKPNNISV